MDREGWKRLKGLRSLIHDGVGRGADFVEKHHRHASSKPFQVLKSVRPIVTPTQIVRTVHDGVLTLTYGSIRVINQAAEKTSGWVVARLAPPDEPDGRE